MKSKQRSDDKNEDDTEERKSKKDSKDSKNGMDMVGKLATPIVFFFVSNHVIHVVFLTIHEFSFSLLYMCGLKQFIDSSSRIDNDKIKANHKFPQQQ